MDDVIRSFVKGGKADTLRSYDGFGTELTFYINGDDKYKTKAGSICTFIYYIVLILIAVYYFQLFLDTKDPDVEASDIRKRDFHTLDLMEQKFYQILLFQDQKTKEMLTIEEAAQYGTIDGVNMAISIKWHGKLETKWNILSQINFSSCKDTNFWKQLKNEPYLHPNTTCFIDHYGLCMNNKELKVSGGLGSDMEFLNIEVRPCNEGPCQDINNLRIHLGFYDTGVDTINQRHPMVRQLVQEHGFDIWDGLSVETEVFLKKISVETDYGIFLTKDTKTEEGLTVHKLISKNSMRKDPAAPVWTLMIKSTNLEYTMERSYIKLMDVFEGVGGVSSVFSVVVLVFYGMYVNSQYRKTLASNTILGDCKNYPEEYKISNNFLNLERGYTFCCCCRKEKKTDMRIRQEEVMNACKKIMDERLDIQNFLQDSMEFQIIRRLLLKKRHQILLPLMSICLAEKAIEEEEAREQEKLKNKKENSQNANLNNSDVNHIKNEHGDENDEEGQSNAIQTAINELKCDQHKSDLEKSLDQFFLENLPDNLANKNRTDQRYCETLKDNKTNVEFVDNNYINDEMVVGLDNQVVVENNDVQKVQTSDNILNQNKPEKLKKKLAKVKDSKVLPENFDDNDNLGDDGLNCSIGDKQIDQVGKVKEMSVSKNKAMKNTKVF